MQLMTTELEERFTEVGSQYDTNDPIIVAKFFDPCGSASWFATEYNPETQIFYGYVTGLAFDEWGTFSLKEMEALERPFGLSIERDLYFKEKHFSEQFKEVFQERTMENNAEKEEDHEHEI